MTNRKFVRTTIVLEVITEQPIPNPHDLEAIVYEMTEGDASGIVKSAEMESIDGYTTAQALLDQSTDPSFFSLTDGGDEEDMVMENV